LRCIGIDLAASPLRESGVAVIEKGELLTTKLLYSDSEIIQFVLSNQPALVAIDAPLTLPNGSGGTYGSRMCDRILQGMKGKYCKNPNFAPFSPSLIAPLMIRGYTLQKRLLDKVYGIIEIHPGTTIEFLELSPSTLDRRKWRKEDWVRLLFNLKKQIHIIESIPPNPHLIDSIIAAYTAKLHVDGKTKRIGDEEEGIIITPLPSRIKLAVFNLDGTLTRVKNSWGYLHERCGLWGEGEVYLKKYLNAEISLKEFLKLTTALWKGRDRREVESILDEIPFIDGLEILFDELEERGIKMAILTTGFLYLIERIKRILGGEEIISFGNEMIYDERNQVKEVKAEVLTKEEDNGKVKWLRRICDKLQVSQINTAFISNSEADEAAFKAVGLSLAFNSSSKNIKGVDYYIEGDDINYLLHLITKRGDA
jgi:HAD superfamily phosphoserine phosphatase-like hydrolase